MWITRVEANCENCKHTIITINKNIKICGRSISTISELSTTCTKDTGTNYRYAYGHSVCPSYMPNEEVTKCTLL